MVCWKNCATLTSPRTTQTSVSGVACAVTTLHPKFRTPDFRKYRAAMYAALGLSAVVFVVHGILLYGLSVQNKRMSLDWMLVMALLNFAGAGVYAARVMHRLASAISMNWTNYRQVPEKWKPRKFDCCGSSHQILHFMVIFAGLAHTLGLFRAFDHVRNYEPLKD